jgi:hypothetical protein
MEPPSQSDAPTAVHELPKAIVDMLVAWDAEAEALGITLPVASDRDDPGD